MAFSSEELARISAVLDAWCEERVPIMVRDEMVMQYRVKRHDVVLFEKRAAFGALGEWEEYPVAKFRFNRTRGFWTLLWCDRNSSWHVYDLAPPAVDFAELVREVDRDRTGIFWG